MLAPRRPTSRGRKSFRGLHQRFSVEARWRKAGSSKELLHSIFYFLPDLKNCFYIRAPDFGPGIR
jgi:hypothetical protein